MYATIFKDSDASVKAWKTRARAIVRVAGSGKGKNAIPGTWKAKDGKPLNEHAQAYVDSVAIPPGWKDVMVATDPDADLIAIGIDAKGRVQPKYSTEHTEESKQVKFARVRTLNAKMPKLVSDSKKDMMNTALKERARDNAATIHLITKTGFRPGGRSEDAFGASTLEKRHVKVEGDTTTFTFTGKHQVPQHKVLKDKDMADYISQRLANIGDGDQVFMASGPSCLRYLKKKVGVDYQVKDLRTWVGTATARRMISKEPVPTNEQELREQQIRVSKAVSKKLGNTEDVAFESYIDPLIWVHTGGLTPIEKKG